MLLGLQVDLLVATALILRVVLVDLGFDERTSVPTTTADEPVNGGKEED